EPPDSLGDDLSLPRGDRRGLDLADHHLALLRALVDLVSFGQRRQRLAGQLATHEILRLPRSGLTLLQLVASPTTVPISECDLISRGGFLAVASRRHVRRLSFRVRAPAPCHEISRGVEVSLRDRRAHRGPMTATPGARASRGTARPSAPVGGHKT